MCVGTGRRGKVLLREEPGGAFCMQKVVSEVGRVLYRQCLTVFVTFSDLWLVRAGGGAGA